MTTWSTSTKNSSSWGTVSKSSGSFKYLLMEDGFYLLQETTDKLILEQSSIGATPWVNISKS